MGNKESKNLIDIIGLILIIVPLLWFSFFKQSSLEKYLNNSLAYSKFARSTSPVGKIVQKNILKDKENFSVLLMERASENKFINSFFTKEGVSRETNENDLKLWVSAYLSTTESAAIKKTAKLQYFPKKILAYKANKIVDSEKIKSQLKAKIKRVNKKEEDRFFPRDGFLFWLIIFILNIFGASFDYLWRVKVNKTVPSSSFRKYGYFFIVLCIVMIFQSNIPSIATLPPWGFVSVTFGLGFELHSRLFK